MDKICLAFTIGLIWCGFASPAFSRTGNELYGECTGETTLQVACINFVVGAVKGYQLGYRTSSTHAAIEGVSVDITFCIPPGVVTAGQMMDVVVQYLRARPDRRHLSAAILVIDAMDFAFPCPE